MKQFAIMDGDMFFQRLEPNERYAKHVSGIQTNRHSYSEYTPIFGHEEKWMDGRTVISYLAGLVEFQMKEFCIACHHEVTGTFPWNTTYKTVVDLCDNCFHALREIAKNKEAQP